MSTLCIIKHSLFVTKQKKHNDLSQWRSDLRPRYLAFKMDHFLTLWVQLLPFGKFLGSKLELLIKTRPIISKWLLKKDVYRTSKQWFVVAVNINCYETESESVLELWPNFRHKAMLMGCTRSVANFIICLRFIY